MTTLSSREFGKHVGRAKKATKNGPVFINHRGKPAYVLVTIENYQQLSAVRGKAVPEKPLSTRPSPSGNPKRSIVDLLSMPPGIEDVEVEFPRIEIKLRPVDFD